MVTALAAPVASAHADVDTDFVNQLHGDGIYGPRDYNAWIGKITCHRLSNGLDASAEKSAEVVSNNLPPAPQPRTPGSSWQLPSRPIARTGSRFWHRLPNRDGDGLPDPLGRLRSV
jgi:hypothetical protein